MSEPNLSGEEKRQQMKEQFKKDLRERQAFLEQMKTLKQQQKVQKAIENLNPEDDTDEWINKLNEESAFHEAKMEMALEASAEKGASMEHTEAELQKSVAEEMVRKLKEEIQKEQSAQIVSPPEAEKTTEKPPRNMLDENLWN